MARTPTLWEGERLTFEHSLALTVQSLQTYGPLYRHWAIAYSGGKDSTAVVTLVASFIASGAIPPRYDNSRCLSLTRPDSCSSFASAAEKGTASHRQSQSGHQEEPDRRALGRPA